MDVKEAIEILKDENRDICYGTTLADEATKLAVEIMERTRWIPVSERLPTEKDANINGLVHVWLKDGNCDYEDWQDVARYAERYQRVTHWMLLPKPPEVE